MGAPTLPKTSSDMISAAKFTGLLSCPVELLDQIVLALDKPCDLLHLALTQWPFYRLIVPCHLIFRRIRCGPGRHYLWGFLIKRPLQASYVKRLELCKEEKLNAEFPRLHQRRLYIPSTVQDESWTLNLATSNDLDERLNLLIPAMSLMTNLSCFHCELDDLPDEWYGKIVSALCQGGCILDSFEFAIGSEMIMHKMLNMDLGSLQRLYLNVNITTWSGTTATVFIQTLGKAIRRCELLTDLGLKVRICSTQNGAETYPEFPILENSWPRLRGFSLESWNKVYDDAPLDSYMSAFELVAGFMDRHQLLENLSLLGKAAEVCTDTCIPMDLLPNLRSLKLSSFGIDEGRSHEPEGLLAAVPPCLLSQLEHIEGRIGPEFLKRLGNASLGNLHSCCVVVEQEILISFLNVVPNLRRLYLKLVEGKPSLKSLSRKEVFDAYLTAKTTSSKPFPFITHLGGCYDDAFSTLHQPSASVWKMIKTFPSLSFLEYAEGQWAHIDRMGQVSYSQVNYREVSHLHWGNFVSSYN